MRVSALALYLVKGAAAVALGAALGDEPLRTLSRMRMREGEPVFGVRYSVLQPGRVRVGDPAEASG